MTWRPPKLSSSMSLPRASIYMDTSSSSDDTPRTSHSGDDDVPHRLPIKKGKMKEEDREDKGFGRTSKEDSSLGSFLPPLKQDGYVSPSRPTRDIPDMHKLWRAGKFKRRYAKAQNRVEERRLQDVQRRVDMAQKVMEDNLARQARNVSRLLLDIEERRKAHANLAHATSPLAAKGIHFSRRRRHKDNNSKAKVAPVTTVSCPVIHAFAFKDERRAPLGRWVRYPPHSVSRMESSIRGLKSRLSTAKES